MLQHPDKSTAVGSRGAMPPHPPHPRLTLRVGITGHRPNKLAAPALARVERQLRQVFDAVDTAARGILAANRAFYADEPPAVRLVSGFAEGADQLAVAACPPGWKVEAILPFPRHDYLDDFAASAAGDGDVRAAFERSLARAATVTELAVLAPGGGDRRGSAARDRAYAAAGGYLLRQIDLLVAVWDGAPPKTGGTGAVARNAVAGGIPVVWLASRDDRVARLIRGFDERGDPVAPETDCTDGPLQTLIEAMFAAPSDAARDARRSARSALADFYREPWPQRCRFTVFDMLKRLANRQRPRLVIDTEPFDVLCRGWDAFIADAPEADNLRRRLREVLLPRYVWADALAVYFSHLYRSAYVLAYALSALAVFIALGGLFLDGLDAKSLCVFLELVAIGAIIRMIALGRRRRWHERWLDYRSLAERLRHGRFLAFVSEFGRLDDRSPDRAGGESSWGESSWIVWYLRATMREIGLPSAAVDAAYQWRILNATLQHEPREQVRYHQGNIAGARRIDHLLHRLGMVCFSATCVVLSVFLAAYLLAHALALSAATAGAAHALAAALGHLKAAMMFVSAGLPALGAALAGIRAHGDFEGSAERSRHMLEALRALERDYARALERELAREETAELLIATARTLSEDLAAWQELYGRKPLALPA